VAFDNMQTRGVVGIADWTRGEVVLDVPNDSEALYFGLILKGKGKAWMNGLSFGVVDLSVAVTTPKKPELPKEPMNLDFTE
jgi:AraC family transcriptional regulator